LGLAIISTIGIVATISVEKLRQACQLRSCRPHWMPVEFNTLINFFVYLILGAYLYAKGMGETLSGLGRLLMRGENPAPFYFVLMLLGACLIIISFGLFRLFTKEIETE
jgi:hypothetical protein